MILSKTITMTTLNSTRTDDTLLGRGFRNTSNSLIRVELQGLGSTKCGALQFVEGFQGAMGGGPVSLLQILGNSMLVIVMQHPVKNAGWDPRGAFRRRCGSISGYSLCAYVASLYITEPVACFSTGSRYYSPRAPFRHRACYMAVPNGAWSGGTVLAHATSSLP